MASMIPLNKRMRGTTGHLHEETFLLCRESFALSLLKNVLVDLVKDLLRVEVDVFERFFVENHCVHHVRNICTWKFFPRSNDRVKVDIDIHAEQFVFDLFQIVLVGSSIVDGESAVP